jgi:hypothetical protein
LSAIAFSSQHHVTPHCQGCFAGSHTAVENTETMASRMLATTAMPPREMPVVLVRPKLLVGVLDKGTNVLLCIGNCMVEFEVELSWPWAAFTAVMFLISVSGTAVFLVRRLSSIIAPDESIINYPF